MPIPVTLRPAHPNDVPAMLALIQELAEYEREPSAVRLTEKQLHEDGFGAQPAYTSVLAEIDGKVIGMALYYPCYSTWNGRAMYLEDLIVSEKARGSGAGKQLMQAVAKASLESGCSQLRWQVLDWNTPAIDFYKYLGAELDPTWLNGRLDESGMRTLTKHT